MSAWTDHVAKWKDCQQCPLCQQRFRICLARGTVPCDILFVGEAPGATEDVDGQPFVGPAGELLERIISQALPQGQRVTCAFTNLVCCFPREAKAKGENEPEYDEIMACRSRLIEFVNIAQPRLVVCVGKLAEEYTPHRMTMKYSQIIHPAAILKSGMPLVRKHREIQRATVTLRHAIEDLLKQPHQPFKKWEDENAGSKITGSRRQHLQQTYGVDSELPF